jgi:oxygen-independent coproporphyrinogen-3 oxidase
LAQYAGAIDLLEEAGFEHYELSNFARPGRCSRHNAIYWANWAYWGFGLGAARYLGGRREMNTRDLPRYLRQTLSGEAATFQVEELPPKERALETLCLGLRRARGVDRSAFHRQTGFSVEVLAGATLQRLIGLDLVRDTGDHIFLTRPGKYVADTIMAQVLAV